MESVRTSYELRVGTHISPAALATFRVPLTPTAVPRKTVYRFRLPADRELTDVVHRLTEQNVEVLEIRRCSGPSRRNRRSPCAESGYADSSGVVVPIRAVTRRSSGSAR